MKNRRFWFVIDDGKLEYVQDNVTGEKITVTDLEDLLNEQQDTIITLKRRLEKINGGYGYLTHRNGLTANEWVIEGQERELKKKNEEISDWIEQHSKNIVKIGEQQTTINKLQEEKEYWESKAMTLLMQVRRLTSRMTDKEVEEFKKELEE